MAEEDHPRPTSSDRTRIRFIAVREKQDGCLAAGLDLREVRRRGVLQRGLGRPIGSLAHPVDREGLRRAVGNLHGCTASFE
jgi:hypothetical protein